MVNPSEGLITGTTRFGALWLPREGGIRLPYNVRFTEKLSDIFGTKLRWLSRSTEAYNLSNTYGARNPVAGGALPAVRRRRICGVVQRSF